MIKSGLAWNKGRKAGQKRALRPQDVWMIRGRLRAEGHKRDLALFNLAIDSKLSACDLVKRAEFHGEWKLHHLTEYLSAKLRVYFLTSP